MSRIRILPENLSNKIAAGEVVERPASVVKELVENAVDAASTRIVVEVERGGRSLIRVSDNGVGMNHDDALLALERHGTSKIFVEEDLCAIRTLGFRGEALPSIASVSRFEMITRDRDSETGVRIEVSGGKILTVAEAGAPVGAMITVRRLFFNTPARRKFLKTDATEMGHLADSLSALALARPSVGFRLVHDGRALKTWDPVGDGADRALDVLGVEGGGRLNPLDADVGPVRVRGWIASPDVTRGTGQKLFLFVNGRHVRDRGVFHAVLEGCRGRLMKGRFPVGVVFIEIPFDLVDVNVHPTKHEVRFTDYRPVHEAVRGAVHTALVVVTPSCQTPSSSSGVAEAAQSFPSEGVSTEEDASASRPPSVSGGRPTGHQAPSQGELWDGGGFAGLNVIGQFRGTYILCESVKGELVLIDQHAAHERILYERIGRRMAGGDHGSQRLLAPETIELGYRETDILNRLLPEFAALGLEIEPFGGNTFVIKAIPSPLADGGAAPVVLEMVEKIADTGFAPGMEAVLDACVMIMACHGAIRAHQRLTREEMIALLKQLDGCATPGNCPHGRPTSIRWSRSVLEKAFKRIV